MYAAYLGHKEMAQLLLTMGANAEAENRYGQTSIMMAASCGSVDVVEILLKNYAKINNRDKYGRSSLHYAIKYNQTKIVEVLLERGADPNLPDLDGMTPTLEACVVGNEAIVVELLKYQHQNRDSSPKTNVSNPVTKLLNELGLEKYIKNFLDYKIQTLDSLYQLNEKDLSDMGITLFGPRKKILNVIQEHRDNNMTPAASQNKPDTIKNNGNVRNEDSRLDDCLRDLQQLSQLCSVQQRELHVSLGCNAEIRETLLQLNKQTKCPNCNILINTATESIIKKLDALNAKLAAVLEQAS